MNIQDRIKQIENRINWYFGLKIYDGDTAVNMYSNHNDKKIIIRVLKRFFVRERRKGRGVQALRIVNLIVNNWAGPKLNPIRSKTLIWGRDNERDKCKHNKIVVEDKQIQSHFYYKGIEYSICSIVPHNTCPVCNNWYLPDEAFKMIDATIQNTIDNFTEELF